MSAPVDLEGTRAVMQRYERLMQFDQVDPMASAMREVAVHGWCRALSLKPETLMQAGDRDFLHDVAGMIRHTDTCLWEPDLASCFTPRCYREEPQCSE